MCCWGRTAIDPSLRVRLAGDGPERAALAALADELGVTDRVEFTGPLTAEALPDFYRSLDALAVPSLTTTSWVEQFGRVALEAMACGTPVVVSDSGALPEVVGGAALVVPEGDPAELAKALHRRPLTRRALPAAGRRARPPRRLVGRVADGLRAALSAGHHAARRGRPPPSKSSSSPTASRTLLARALAPLDGLSGHRRRQLVLARRPGRGRAAPGSRYVDPGHNGGFGSGVNEGLRTGHPTADVLLSTPMQSRPATSRRCAPHSRPTPAGQRRAPAGRRRRRAARVFWPFPSPLGTWVEAVGSGAVTPQRLRHRVGAAASRARPSTTSGASTSASSSTPRRPTGPAGQRGSGGDT